jgi:mannose/cellobiose epimerase-like protein (N-acyl-D-glucosamine 2-epimerase family)
MKLWWPHCEALVAFAYAFSVTKLDHYLERFRLVADYTFAHFPDTVHGEWYGYLDRDGVKTHRCVRTSARVALPSLPRLLSPHHPNPQPTPPPTPHAAVHMDHGPGRSRNAFTCVHTCRFKGGPYKGCFHVPRALFMVEMLLKRCRVPV